MKCRYFLFFVLSVFCFNTNAISQLVSDNAFLQGRYLEAAVAPNGSWGSTVTVPAGYNTHPGGAGTAYIDPVTHVAYTGNDMDFSYDPGHDGWTVGSPAGTPCCFYGPFFMPGTPFDGWSMQVNGARSDAFYTNYGFWNGTPASNTLSGTVTSYTYTPGCPGVTESYMTGVWTGTAGPGGGLSVVQTNRIDTLASWVIVNTIFTNNTATAMTGLYYFVTGDPDNDEVITGGSFPTNNRITYQNDATHRVLVWGRPPSLHQDAFSSLSTKDCRAKALIYTTWSPYPAESTANTLDMIYAGTAAYLGPSYYAAGDMTLDQDIAYGLIFNLGNLAPGQSTFVSYAWGFSDSTAVDSAFQQPELNVNCSIVATSAVNTATINPCPLTSVPASIVNGYWGTTTWNWSPAIGLATTAGTVNTINVLALVGNTTYTITPSDTMACDHFPPFYLTVLLCFDATNNGPICLGDTLKLTAHGDSTGATYTWYGPGLTGPVIGTGQFLDIYPSSFADSGTFYVIKTADGISDTANTHVVIRPLPAVTATSNAPICSGNTLLLFANPDSTGETFSWTRPVAFSSALQNPTVTPVFVANSGTYKVVVSLNGCIDSNTVNVVIDSTPVIPSAANNSPVCSGNTLLLTSTDATPGVSYSWAGPGGYISGLQYPSITPVTTAAAGVYTVTATLAICQSSNTTTVTINQTPPAPTLTSNSPVCSGNALTFTASSTAGSTYNWGGPNGFSSTLENPTISPATTAATGAYTVIATLNGCPSEPAKINVVVDSTPVVPTAGSNSPVCSGNTLQLTSSDPSPGVTYSWSGPLGFTSGLQNPTITAVTTGYSGTYTVTASIGACQTYTTTTVVINQAPPAPILGSNSPICSGNILNFTDTSTTGATYSWSGPDGFTSTLQDPSISPANTLATGLYSVTASLNGCTAPVATIFVVVDSTPGTPVASSNSPGTPAICQGDTLMLVATDPTAGVTYTWVGPNSFSSTLQNPDITNVTPAADGTYTVTVNQGTCMVTAITVVYITPTPSLTDSSNSPICTGLNDTLYLFANSDPGATYLWSGPHVFISANQNPFRTPVLLDYGGIYIITVTLNGCTNTANDTVIVNQTPGPPWMSWLTYCQFYDAPPMQSNGLNILWYPSSAPGAPGTTVAPTPPTSADTVMWFYTTQTVNGCISPIDSIKVTPTPLLTVSPGVDVCPHDSAVLTATSSDTAATYLWIPSIYLNDTTTASVTTYPETDITYTVVASNQFGCADTGAINVIVHPAGVIDLGDSSVTLYGGETYQLNPQTNCYTFEWTPDIGLSDPFISNPLASPTVSTKYIVYGTTAWGCKTSDSINIFVDPNTLLTVPNAFTPGNGPNNEFKIIKLGIATLNYFRIWDRWGNKVFETTNIDQGWDGTYKGVPQPQAVFVYEISAITEDGQNFKKHGNVTLLR